MADNTECVVGTPAGRHGQRRVPRSAIWLLVSLLLLINLTSGVFNIPLNRLLEQVLCRQHYSSDHDVGEERCKVDKVQQELAWIMGSFETLWIMGDFVTTIPLSFVAEKCGRRLVLLLNLVPRFFMLLWILATSYFMLPPQFAIAGAALSVLGGDTVFNSLIYSLAAKLAEDNATRAVYFSWMTALTSVIGFLSPALGVWVMNLLLALPFWLGVIFIFFAIPVVLLIPIVDDITEDRSQDRRPLISSPALKAQASGKSITACVRDRVSFLVSFFNESQPALLLASMFLTSVASADTKLLAQYISKRYHWTFASAGYLLSAKAVVNFILLSFVVPLFLATREHASQALSDRANATYARFCLMASICGAFLIGVAATISALIPGLLIYAMGVPLSIFTLSLANSLRLSSWKRERVIDGQAHVFSVVMMVKTLGSLVGAPLMAALWYYGIELGFYGSPYIASSMLYMVGFGVFWGIATDHH